VLEASVILSWVVIAVLALVVLALARQIGVLHERVAPVGALALSGGPAVGEAAPRLAARTLDGAELIVGAPSPRRRLQLLLFVAPHCPVCKAVIPIARGFSRAERVDLVLVGDGGTDELRRMAERHGLEGVAFVNAPQIGLAYQVGKLPYAVLLDRDAKIAAKGLVNSREHLESLVVAHEAIDTEAAA
jgi:methylamine dehydrogenase accessory protein MauD